MALSAADAQLVAKTLLGTKLSNGYTLEQTITDISAKVNKIQASGVSVAALAAELKK